jgi:hypothetical protein
VKFYENNSIEVLRLKDSLEKKNLGKSQTVKTKELKLNTS